MTESVFTERYAELRKALIGAREDAGLTQADVASRLGRPQSFVSKYERAERRLDVVEFLEVAEVLGVDPCTILRRVRTQRPGTR